MHTPCHPERFAVEGPCVPDLPPHVNFITVAPDTINVGSLGSARDDSFS